MKMNRRHAIKTTMLAATAAAFPATVSRLAAQTAAVPPGGPFVLPPLGYAFDALEPHFDATTMEIHHDKHHGAYVTNLNKAVAAEASLAGQTVEQLLAGLGAIPEAVRQTVRNNAGGHANHSLFWRQLKKGGGSRPTGEAAKAIEAGFGSLDSFRGQLTRAALGLFGSGWSWLSLAHDGKLQIETTPNQDTPLLSGRPPVFGLDVWEHAYYLKFQNRRADYITAFWQVLDWDFVSERYATLRREQR
jgi:superoxide dismutase, Fe-Mn family